MSDLKAALAAEQEKGIHSAHNACMFREECRAQAKRIAELEAEIARLRKLLEPPKSWRDDPELEAKAKAIYETWKDQDGWVPWVAYGNSTKQDEARAAAQKEPS